MIFDEFPIPFTWYDDIRKQNRFKENINSDQIFKLIAMNDTLLPTQFRASLGAVISSLQIMDEDGTVISTLKPTEFTSEAVAGYQYFTWFAAANIKTVANVDLNLPCGSYYLKVSFTGFDNDPLFSEIFHVMPNMADYFVLEWFNSDWDIDPVYYRNGYKNKIYADTFITKGVPSVELETEADGFGNTVTLSRKMINNYDFSLMVVPNFMVDALNFMCLHDTIRLITKSSTRSGVIENVTIEQDQIDTLAYWEVTVKFNQPTFYFNGSCPTAIANPQGIREIIIYTGKPENTWDLVFDGNNNI